MVNPFDRAFFKFLSGFIFILLASFSVLYFVNNASFATPTNPQALTAEKK